MGDAMTNELQCWKCGAKFDTLLPIARTDICPKCRADLHACRACHWFDTAVANSCREPIADPVTDKERANFCGYFKPRANAYRASSDAGSKAQLAALFGEAPPAAAGGAAADPKEALAALFRKDSGS